jgi:hypothetical protein
VSGRATRRCPCAAEGVGCSPLPDAARTLKGRVIRGLAGGDGSRLRQRVVNRESNAVKFTPSGEVEVTVTRPAPGGPRVFAVRDPGPGIAEADRGRIFLPFVQTEVALDHGEPAWGWRSAGVWSRLWTGRFPPGARRGGGPLSLHAAGGASGRIDGLGELRGCGGSAGPRVFVTGLRSGAGRLRSRHDGGGERTSAGRPYLAA